MFVCHLLSPVCNTSMVFTTVPGVGFLHGSFHKQCTRWQNCGVDDAISVKSYASYSWRLEEAARVFDTSQVYAVLNWRVLDMASAGTSGTVTVEDQRSYIKNKTLRGKIQNRNLQCFAWSLRWADSGPYYSLPLGHSFSWMTYHHKRWPKTRKAKNINR
jgi:hypothetical protein